MFLERNVTLRKIFRIRSHFEYPSEDTYFRIRMIKVPWKQVIFENFIKNFIFEYTIH